MLSRFLASALVIQLCTAAHPAPQDETKTHVATRVVDSSTGEPIAGAFLDAVDERSYPHLSSWDPVRRAVSDAEGRARMRIDDIRDRIDWYFISAAGYATQVRFEDPPEAVTPLPRGIEVPVEVRDALDRPVPGMRLELLLGCGHTPAAQVVTTDERGRATFRNVELDSGQIWPVKRGFKGVEDYLDWDETWRPGDGPMILRAGFGDWASGVVLDHLGRPAAGVPIGRSRVHRGPWARTDEHGRFLLTGLHREDEVLVYPTEQQPSGRLYIEVAPPGREMVLRLPPPGEDADETGRELRVRVIERGSAWRLEGALVQAVRDGDAFTYSDHTDEAGLVTLHLPDGRYTLLANSGVGTHADAREHIEVPSERKSLPTIAMSPNPTIAVRCDGFPVEPPEEAEDREIRIELVTLRGSLDITERVRRNEPIHVPAAGPFSFWIGNVYRHHFVPGPVDRSTSEPVVLSYPRPHVITVELRDPEGRPMPGWVALSRYSERELGRSPDPPAPQWRLSTQYGGGHYFLIAHPADTERFEDAILELHLPSGQGAILDAGTLVFPRR